MRLRRVWTKGLTARLYASGGSLEKFKYAMMPLTDPKILFTFGQFLPWLSPITRAS